MKISAKTISILQNFANINEGINIKKGNVLSTISNYNVIVGKAEVDEIFPKNCGIANLKTFLNVLGTFNSPTLSFGNEFVNISENNRCLSYIYDLSNAIKSPPDNIPPMQDFTSFTLNKKDFDDIKKTASIMGLSELVFVGNGENISLVCKETKNQHLGNFVINTDIQTDKEFAFIFMLENLNIISGDYDVRISNAVGHFQNKELNVQYWAALEKHSRLPE